MHRGNLLLLEIVGSDVADQIPPPVVVMQDAVVAGTHPGLSLRILVTAGYHEADLVLIIVQIGHVPAVGVQIGPRHAAASAYADIVIALERTVRHKEVIIPRLRVETDVGSLDGAIGPFGSARDAGADPLLGGKPCFGVQL